MSIPRRSITSRRANKLAAVGVVAAVLVLHAAVPTHAGESGGARQATARTNSALVPALTVHPTQQIPGSSLVLTGTGFTPTGQIHIRWDGAFIDRFIHGASTFNRIVNVPFGAAPGPHTIIACWSVLGSEQCEGGDLAQQAQATVTVLAPPPDPDPGIPSSHDFTIETIEVTQGLRGDLPTSPDRRLTDDFPHIANRRTVVRAYPRVTGSLDWPPVVAYLQVQDSTGEWSEPIWPITRQLIVANVTLADLRAYPYRTFNFVLPAQHTQAGDYTMRVIVNPIGPDRVPECTLCTANNETVLERVDFGNYQERDIQVQVAVLDLAYRDGDGNVVTIEPSMPQIWTGLSAWLATWPIDPTRFRVSYRYYRVSASAPVDPAAPGAVNPPIDGYPTWNLSTIEADFLAGEYPDAGGFFGARRPPYTFQWQAFGFGGIGAGNWGTSPRFQASAGCAGCANHEAAHTLGFNHAGNSHGEDLGGGHDPNYPDPHGGVEPNAFGFDVWEMRVIPPVNGDNHQHDFMSYGGEPYWVSLYTYQNLLNLYRPGTTLAGMAHREAPVARADGEYVRIGGTIAADGRVWLNPVFRVTAPAPAEGSGSYTLTLRNGAGDVLAQRSFEVDLDNPSGLAEFSELLPAVDGLARLEVSRNGQLIGARSVSPAPPTVEILSPRPGDRWAATGDTVVEWTGRDPDGDAVTYRVQVSADGQRWETIHLPTSLTRAVVHLPHVPGGGAGWRVRVQASDGLNVSASEVGDLTIDPKPPIPAILNPARGTFVGVGGSVDARGQGYDFQDGSLPAASLQWLIDGRSVGTGESVSTGALAAGEHTLTLRATNSAGLVGSTDVRITVGVDADGDRLPDAWESSVGLNPSNVEDAYSDLDGDGWPNWQEYTQGSDPKNSADPAAEEFREFRPAPVGELAAPTQPQSSWLTILFAALGAAVVLIVAVLIWLRIRAHRRPERSPGTPGPAEGTPVSS